MNRSTPMRRTPMQRAPPQPTRAAIEAAQRKRMTAKFATRPKTPSTADFDLPAPNDARIERVITPRCTALRVSGLSGVHEAHHQRCVPALVLAGEVGAT